MNAHIFHDKLLANAKAAMVAAIEVYNKPTALYRDECVVILVLNAWELALKAILAKNGRSIFRRDKENFTLSWKEALGKAQSYFPKEISYIGVMGNLDVLDEYRNNSIHFYNEKDFGIFLYSLFQTSILNFRDVVSHCLDTEIEDMITWSVLPIAFDTPIDVVSYISNKSSDENFPHLKQFFSKLMKTSNRIKKSGGDTGRLMTIFDVKLKVVKKIGDADAILNVSSNNGENASERIVERAIDPNESHKYRRKDVLTKLKFPKGITSSAIYACQAITWKYKIKSQKQYCWEAQNGALTLYSDDFVTWINRLTKKDIESAISDYREHCKLRNRRKKKKALNV